VGILLAERYSYVRGVASHTHLIMTNTIVSFSSRIQAVITAVFAMFALVTSLLAPIAEVYATTSPYDWGPDWYYVEEPYSYTTDTYTYTDTYYDYSYPYSGGYSSYYYDDYGYNSYYDSTTYSYTETSYDYNYQYNTCAQTTCGCGGCSSTSAPEVTTKSATNITETSATLRCSLDDTGDLATDVWFEYGTSQYNLSRSTSHDTYSSSRTIEKGVTGLSDDTTYYYRCMGQNSKGTDTGSVMSFRTKDAYEPEPQQKPTLTTQAAVNISETSATLKCSVNPNGDTTTARFEWGTSASSLSRTTSSRTYSSTTTMEQYLSGLSANTTYYYRCTGENGGGSATGSTLSFRTGEAYDPTSTPEVTTKSATNITETSATLRCSLDDTGDLATDVWFEYGTSQYNLSRSTSHDTYSSSRTIEKGVTGLSDDTTYYYRCMGQNSKGTDTGSVMSFRTGEGEEDGEEPEVETKSATNIDEDSATLRCYVNPNDSDTDVWFEYGETTSMNDDTSKQKYDDVRTVERSVTGLAPDTKYYFRCVAKNDEGKVYGDRLYFTTKEGEEDELPFVSTNQPTNVSASSATFNGYVNPRGDSNTERWFEYGPTLSLGYSTSRYRQGSSAGNFSDYVSSLNDNTTYYYRAVARNNTGTNYGNIVSFRTGTGGWTNQAPVATTGNATNIGRSSARFTGNVSVPTSAYTTAWFEWGTTQSLGRSTSAQAVSGSSMFVEHSQFSLDYATTYYYRLVVQNTYGVSRGHIVSFTTLSAPNGGTTTYVPYVAPVTKEYGARVTKTVENLDAPNGSSTEVFAERGQALRFAIRVENTGDYTLEDVTIRDLIPYYLEFANAEESLRYDGTRREVVWYVGELRKGESREVTLDMVVTDDARLGSTIENIARLESDKHEEVSNSIFIRVTDDVLADAKANRNAGAAAAFLGWDGIFPDTLLGWLIFTILLLIIIVLIRQLVLFYNEHKAKRAMQYVPQVPVAPVAYQSAQGPYAPTPATLPVAPVAYPTAPNAPQGTQTVFPMGPAGQQ